MKGFVNSIQSLGTVDGPGIRYVVFLQGCPLRCGCCHNPDTWEMNVGESFTAKELVDKAERFREYFGDDGGITLSGGEPLLQPEFVREVFRECRQRGIHTCLDTSGCIWNEEVEELLRYTDRVLLDIKYTTEEAYRNYVGCSMETPLKFLEYLNQRKIPVTLRQVMIPGLNDTDENIRNLASIVRRHPCIDTTELLAFRKLCKAKYDNLKMPFRFEEFPEPSKGEIKQLEEKLQQQINK